MTKYPSIRTLMRLLEYEHLRLRKQFYPSDLDDGEGNIGTDVRLQVLSDDWRLHTGDAQYDTDHRGYWGVSWLPYGRGNLRDIARDLIDQARDDQAERERQKWLTQSHTQPGSTRTAARKSRRD